MHPQLKLSKRVKRLRNVALVSTVLLLAGCASGPTYQPADVESRDLESASNETDRYSEQDYQVEPLEEREANAERAEYYQQRARQGNQKEQIDARLSSAEYFIQANDYQEAERTVGALAGVQMDTVERDRYDVIVAYIAYSRKDYQGALQRLATVLRATDDMAFDDRQSAEQPGAESGKIASTQKVDALLLSSFCYQALDEYDSAIDALAKREAALVGTARAETTRYLWQVINSISRERRESIIQTTQSPLVRNRLEQSLNGQFGEQTAQPPQFTQWREDLSQELKQVLDVNWNEASPRRIAVLLPITSKFKTPSQALMDGIKYQHEQNSSPNRPEISFYDIGENPYQAPQFYTAAVQAGADLIIGPLGKEYANQVNAYVGRTIPTILLGGKTPLASSMNRLTMSPEIEGLRVAERALRNGHLTAALLVPEGSSSQRSVEAFSRHWLQNGGKISRVVNYSKRQFDHSVELKQLFDINQSETRHRQLTSALGFRPKFSAYKRSDIDFIFMIADNESGRIVRPQINFFSGSKIPVYSTSDLFNGLHDSIQNQDLDDTRFPVMPWVLESKEVAPYAGRLNMLFAIGRDAYQIAGQLRNLRNDASLAINGSTGQLNVNSSGEINYQPIWAKFVDGEAVTDTALSPNLRPINSSQSESRSRRSNGKGNYDDSNWNPRESRRKTGS